MAQPSSDLPKQNRWSNRHAARRLPAESNSEISQALAEETLHMSTTNDTQNGRRTMGRFSVDFEVANHKDVIRVEDGNLAPDHVRRAKLAGVVDTGATRLVLPASIVAMLGLPQSGPIGVQYADGRRDQKMVVGDV